MSKISRSDDICSYIYSHESVSLPELCDTFSISMSTLRREIKNLVESGEVEKVYGGVQKSIHRGLTPLSKRKLINYDGKIAIAQAAAELIKDRDVIFLDSGSTVGALAGYLGLREGITVITNNYLAIQKIVPMQNISLITLSGKYYKETYSFVGENATELLQKYNISKAFMGTSGLSIKSGVSHSTSLEASIKKQAVKSAQSVIVLADHLKFDCVAPLTYTSFDDVDIIVTDKEPSEEYLKLFKQTNTHIKTVFKD